MTYQWQERRPEILTWARELVELRFDSSRIATVDQRVIAHATRRDTTTQWVRLFYERAGVMLDERTLHVMGEGNNPVQFEDMKDELERRLSKVAASGEAGSVSQEFDAA